MYLDFSGLTDAHSCLLDMLDFYQHTKTGAEFPPLIPVIPHQAIFPFLNGSITSFHTQRRLKIRRLVATLCVFLPIMLICFSRILLRAMSMATSGVEQWSGGWAAVFDSNFSSAQKWVCIILNHLALLAASKHTMAATINVAGAKIGLEADIQSIKPNRSVPPAV